VQILICGAYGQGNAGDEAVLDALLQEIRKTGVPAEVTVLSKNCRETERRADVTAVHSFFIPGVLRAMRKADVVLQGGGNLLQNQTSTRSLLYYLSFLEQAHRMGKQTWLIGCGFGPFQNRLAKRQAFRTLRRCAAGGSIRDPDSLRQALENGLCPERFLLSSDLTFALAAPPAESRCGAVQGNTLGIVPCGNRMTPAWESALADLARKRYRERGTQPVLLCLQRREDAGAAARIEKRIQDIPHTVIIIPPSGDTFRNIFADLSETVSFRLHGLLFSVSGSIPCAALGTDPKLAAFAADAGGAVPTVAEPSADAMAEALDYAAGRKRALDAAREKLVQRQKGNSDLLRIALTAADFPNKTSSGSIV
jgi:polysaccharide pyruvyl transferase CsaB